MGSTRVCDNHQEYENVLPVSGSDREKGLTRMGTKQIDAYGGGGNER